LLASVVLHVSTSFLFLFFTTRAPPSPPLFPSTPLSRSARPRLRSRDKPPPRPSASWSSPRSSPPPASRRSATTCSNRPRRAPARSEEHTSELQSLTNLVCRLLLEKKKKYEPLLQHQTST